MQYIHVKSFWSVLSFCKLHFRSHVAANKVFCLVSGFAHILSLLVLTDRKTKNDATVTGISWAKEEMKHPGKDSREDMSEDAAMQPPFHSLRDGKVTKAFVT